MAEDAERARVRAQILAATSALRGLANGVNMTPIELMRMAEDALANLDELGKGSIEVEHPGPWRIGNNLYYTFMGPVTLYDGNPVGDGFYEDNRRKPGRVIGIMFSTALGELVCQVMNAHFNAKRAMGEDR